MTSLPKLIPDVLRQLSNAGSKILSTRCTALS